MGKIGAFYRHILLSVVLTSIMALMALKWPSYIVARNKQIFTGNFDSTFQRSYFQIEHFLWFIQLLIMNENTSGRKKYMQKWTAFPVTKWSHYFWYLLLIYFHFTANCYFIFEVQDVIYHFDGVMTCQFSIS